MCRLRSDVEQLVPHFVRGYGLQQVTQPTRNSEWPPPIGNYNSGMTASFGHVLAMQFLVILSVVRYHTESMLDCIGKLFRIRLT